MIEELIEQHIKSKLAEAYPLFPADQVIIQVTGGQMAYKQKSRDYLGTETLQAAVVMSNETAFDRLAFLRAFPRGGIMLNEVQVWQEYKSHERKNNVEAAKNVNIIFRLEFKYDIKRA